MTRPTEQSATRSAYKPFSMAQSEREVERLRYEARLAYLDGRVSAARTMNKKADALHRAVWRQRIKPALPEQAVRS